MNKINTCIKTHLIVASQFSSSMIYSNKNVKLIIFAKVKDKLPVLKYFHYPKHVESLRARVL